MAKIDTEQAIFNCINDIPKSVQDVSFECGFSERTCRDYIKSLHKQREIRIYDYIYHESGGKDAPRYVLGRNEDAPKNTQRIQEQFKPFRHWLDVALFGEYRVS